MMADGGEELSAHVDSTSPKLSPVCADMTLDLPNGKVKQCPKVNGLQCFERNDCSCKDRLKVTSSANCLTEDDKLNGENAKSECNSQRNSSTSDSGIYGSDADHTPCKSEEIALAESVGQCQISDEPHAQEASEKSTNNDEENGIDYVVYDTEQQMPNIMRLITKDLSEPYSIYTYRYFIHNWPKLCFLAMCGKVCVGAIVCKLDLHKKMVRRGYIAMLAVDENYRRRGIGSHLVLKAIRAMVADDCDEVVLETEITNKSALQLYENLGFVRDKRLFRYYLNGVDALRLKLWLR